MEQVPVPGGHLEARSDGEGEPILLIHGSIIADTFHALRSQQALADEYRLITYNRRGFAGSVHHTGPFTIQQQAEDALAVLRHFGIDRAHVAGHSYGGVTALQLALDAPGAVHSLVLLEPALVNVPAGPAFLEGAGPVVEAYQSGDIEAAVTKFIGLVFPEPNWRQRIDPHLPAGYWKQSLDDASTMFEVEFPALGDWLFTEADAARTTAPVLSVVGADSVAVYGQGQQMMRSWWPSAEAVTLPSASHNLHFANPSGAATAIAAFLAKHPM